MSGLATKTLTTTKGRIYNQAMGGLATKTLTITKDRIYNQA